MYVSHQRVTGSCGDAAVVLFVFGHVDVALHSPFLTPAEIEKQEKLNDIKITNPLIHISNSH